MKMNSQHIHNLTQNKDLNIRPEAVILLGENIGEKLHDIGLVNNLLDITPKAWTIKAKIKTFHSIENMQQRRQCRNKWKYL